MATRQKWDPRGWAPRTWAVIAIIVGAALVAIGAYTSESHTVWSELARDVGISFIVFGLVTATFEHFTHEQLVLDVNDLLEDAGRKINEAVDRSLVRSVEQVNRATAKAVEDVRDASADKVLAEAMGDSAYQIVRGYTKLGRTFSRSNATLDVEIDALSGTVKDWVRLSVSFRYVVRNETDTEARYVFGSSEDICPGSEAVGLETKVTEISWNDKEQPYQQERILGNSVVLASSEQRLPGLGRGTASVSSHIYRRLDDHYDIAMSYFTEDVYIHVRHPNNFEVRAGGLGDLEMEFEEDPSGPKHVTSWRVRGAILPKQGITLRWKRIDA